MKSLWWNWAHQLLGGLFVRQIGSILCLQMDLFLSVNRQTWPDWTTYFACNVLFWDSFAFFSTEILLLRSWNRGVCHEISSDTSRKQNILVFHYNPLFPITCELGPDEILLDVEDSHRNLRSSRRPESSANNVCQELTSCIRHFLYCLPLEMLVTQQSCLLQ